MNNRMVVIGSLNMDLVVYAPRHPLVGETIMGSSFFTNPGGKGANQAVAAARLGGIVTMVGKLGGDPFASQLKLSLQSNNVNIDRLMQDQDATTGIALITIGSDGDNSIIVVPGSNMLLSPQDIDKVEELIASADLLLFQLEIPIPTVLHAAKIGKTYGARVVLNPAPAQTLPQELLGLIDLLILNETETAILTGCSIDNDEALVAAGKLLVNRIPGEVILTLGEKGCMWLGKSRVVNTPAFPVHTVDTTAAGDAFIAGVVVAMMDNRSIEDALRWGNAAGAITVTRRGAQSALPDREQVEEFIRNNVI